MKPCCVLVVEDNEITRLMIVEVLRNAGYEVIEAKDGNEAIRHLDQLDCIDALLTDVWMPGLVDGYDVALHARKRDPTIPVVISSTFAGKGKKRVTQMQPAPVFLDKLYLPFDIVTTMKSLVETRTKAGGA